MTGRRRGSGCGRLGWLKAGGGAGAGRCRLDLGRRQGLAVGIGLRFGLCRRLRRCRGRLAGRGRCWRGHVLVLWQALQALSGGDQVGDGGLVAWGQAKGFAAEGDGVVGILPGLGWGDVLW